MGVNGIVYRFSPGSCKADVGLTARITTGPGLQWVKTAPNVLRNQWQILTIEKQRSTTFVLVGIHVHATDFVKDCYTNALPARRSNSCLVRKFFSIAPQPPADSLLMSGRGAIGSKRGLTTWNCGDSLWGRTQRTSKGPRCCRSNLC